MTSFASEVTVTQSTEFFSRFGRFGGNMQSLKQLLSDDERMRAWVQSLNAPTDIVMSGPYLVSVDRSLSLTQMIRSGKYNNEKGAIASITEERFPVDRSGQLQYKKELFLVAPSRDRITTTNWKAELEANHWVLEETPELLALGAKYHSLQLENYIIAFGSSWRSPDVGLLRSPVLWSVGDERKADTDWVNPDDRWSLPYRALVSRKQDLGRLNT